MLTASGVKEPQAAERAQPVLGVVEALRYLKGLCPGRASLGNGTSGMYRRCTQCGMKLHLAARVRLFVSFNGSKRSFNPRATLVQQRQVHPEGHRGGGQRHADRSITARREGPVERR